MVTAYVPEAGDIVFIDFDPQVGHEQAKRRPALVLTDQRYNRASRLVVVCPVTSKREPYPFALPVKVDKVEGAILVDQLKSLDSAGPSGTISFQSRGNAAAESAPIHRRAAWNSLT